MAVNMQDLISEKVLPRDPERVAKHIGDLLLNNFTVIDVTPLPDDKVLVRMERRADSS